MNVIVCIDDNFGMMFNHRRQSRDRVVIEDMIKNLSSKKIHMNSYSASLFLKYKDYIEVDENFMDNPANDDFYFIENVALLDYKEQIDTIILYRWNRNYPDDFYFDLPLDEYDLIYKTEFVGYSHEKITKEIYKKRGEL